MGYSDSDSIIVLASETQAHSFALLGVSIYSVFHSTTSHHIYTYTAM